jgi:hypothetical protein
MGLSKGFIRHLASLFTLICHWDFVIGHWLLGHSSVHPVGIWDFGFCHLDDAA